MADNRSVLVVGLGRFGSAVATTLDAMGQDVLAGDRDPDLVNRWSSQIPTVLADMTDVLALEQLNAADFDTAVVAIGDSVEASVITAGNLLDAGISDISWRTTAVYSWWDWAVSAARWPPRSTRWDRMCWPWTATPNS